MKTIATLLTLAVLTVTSTHSALAGPPRPRQDAGVVRQIDHAGRNLTLTSLQEASKTLHWDADTQFWKDGEESSSSAITRGTVVKCSYRLPAVGPVSLTKVTIVAKAKKKSGGGGR